MLKNKRILGLINARGGSKGIPGKNIRPLCGKPLIAYSIESGHQAGCLDRLVVSTDSTDIADIAKTYGADVPFIRPPELATDKAKQIDAITHAVSFLEQAGESYDYICLLQPTCPMRKAEDIVGTMELIIDKGTDSAITITDVGGRHPNTLYKIGSDGELSPYIQNSEKGVLRQEFENLYWRTGSVYAMKRDVLMAKQSLYGESTCGYMVPEERCFNLDSLFDWDLCESYMMRFKS
jgi:CMP-N-acetylneuraminic acid synthetase